MTMRLACCALFLLPFSLEAQTSPEEFLGHRVGADRMLADYHQIRAYFEQLDEESGKVSVVNIGETTLGEPMIMAVITSENNMANLDRYREITRRLSDPRGVSPEEAERLSQEGKVIILITHGLHASEIGMSQGVMESAYRLATGNTPFDADEVLDEVIVLLIPVANPDGQLMITDWYREYLGTKYEGGPMPWLYHHYAGHDNNRDGIANNLVETRAVSSVIWHDWFPQIYNDPHQMGKDNARMFVPQFMDPADPNIHPLIFTGVGLIGANMAHDLQKAGLKGVVHDALFSSAWWKGTLTSNAMVHNTTGLFTELASVNIATPVYVDPNEIPEFYSKRSLRFPDPWPGGWWHMRNIVDYLLNSTMSLVEIAAREKEAWLYNYYRMGRDAVDERRPGDPYAFVIPPQQRDYPTTLRTIEMLQFGRAEIHQAREAFVADGKAYPEGTFVIPVAQPYRPYVLNMLGERKYPSGVPRVLQDNASHALPMQMGVEFSQIDEPFEASLELLSSIPYPSAMAVPSTPYIVLDARENAAYAVAVALLEQDAEVYRSTQGIEGDGFHVPAGSFIVGNTSRVQDALPALQEQWHASAYGLADMDNTAAVAQRLPRIGLYQSWRSNMDEGWTRFVLEDFGIPYTTLHNENVRGNLNGRYDVIVFADESPAVIETGLPEPGTARYASALDAYPPEYDGGIGEAGIEALQDFVADGGILVALDNAGPLFTREFDLPVRNALEGLPASEFFVPTSLLRIEVDNATPIGYGMPSEAAAMFFRSVAYTTWLPPSGDWDRQVVASYPQDDVLLRGWMLGEEQLARRAAVVDAGYRDGRVILIGFRTQHRGQTHGTYKFLFNALLYPEMN